MTEPTSLSPKRNIGKKIRTYFFTGLLVLVPLGLTYSIIKLLFLTIDDILSDTVSTFILQQFGIQLGEKQIPGIGIATLFILILLTGIIAHNYFGKKIVDFGEQILAKIPLINRVYVATKQISQAFFSPKREVFKKAVLIEFPKEGSYCIGFYTQDTRGPIQNTLKEEMVNIFLPTAPNPTTGFLLFVNKTEIIELDLSIEEALKLVISGGILMSTEQKTNKFSAVAAHQKS
jgi:uncharacterized membrane protein